MKLNLRTYILYLMLILLGIYLSKCTPTLPPLEVDCTTKIDSINSFWMDVVKNISSTVPDSINWIDSLRIKDSTVINWVDSTRWNFIDSLVIEDSVKIRDSLVLSLRESYEIKPDSVRLDVMANEDDLIQMFDDKPFITRSGDRGTRWAVPGYPHQAMFYFDTTYVVTEIWVNTFAWDEGYTHYIKLYFYGMEIGSIETEEALYSKHEIFYVGDHLYFEVVGGRNNYTDIGEIKVFGYKLGDK